MKHLKKQIKISLAVFGLIGSFLLIYFFISFQPVKISQTGDSPGEGPTISREEMGSNYRRAIRPAFQEVLDLAGRPYRATGSAEALIASTSPEYGVFSDGLTALKFKVMEMRVPEENKDWHLSLVFALDDIKSALDTGDQELYKEKYEHILSLEPQIP